jgi:uncharacterized protein YdaL
MAGVLATGMPTSAIAASPHNALQGGLPAPPPPPTIRPSPPRGAQQPTALLNAAALQSGPATTTSATAPTSALRTAVTWGTPVPGAPDPTTLVLYDSTNTYGWLGELYGIGAGNLASHFGTITAEPVVNYQAGQVNNYTATVYLGSTYNEPLPTTFLNDVLSTTHPVIWADDNVWQLSGTEGSSADHAFISKYGWDPSSSYFDSSDNVATVSYKGQGFSRNLLNTASGILAPHITNATAVSVLAQANCTSSSRAPVNCAAIAQSSGTSFPWALRSANLTYVGEIPFSYTSETDRYVAFSDLLFAAETPAAPVLHQAIVRLEDVSPISDPTALRRYADYLSGKNIPFSVNVIPEYTDPNGFFTGGIAQTLTLAQAPAVVSALKYIQTKGGTLNQEGYTHQYSNLANPYNGVSGDDAEFFRAQCSTTQNPPYNFQSPCQNADWVIWTGPLPGDSSAAAAARVTAGQQLFTQAGLPVPSVWVTPHYFASAADYAAIDSKVATRYDRDVFASGQLSGQPLNYSRLFGQFFPYVVHDVYGEKVLPENLGDYEPTTSNNNPPRLPSDIIHNAQVNLAVTQSVASFFFDPSADPNPSDSSPFGLTVNGIKNLGYTYVKGTSLPG